MQQPPTPDVKVIPPLATNATLPTAAPAPTAQPEPLPPAVRTHVNGVPVSGPEAIEYALSKINLDQLEEEQRQIIKANKKTSRPKAVKLLNVAQGLKKNGIEPKDLMLRSVPVIPHNFRPFSVTGDTFLPGDANEMYRDLVEYRRLYQDHEKTFGKAAAGEVYADLNKAVKAAYGYGDSPNPKIKARAVKGFFDVVTGTNPKTSWYQSKLLSKPQDTVGRGVIVPDADLDMDEVGIPEEMAWKIYSNYTQRRLVKSGMSPAAALKHVKDRTPQARKALEAELPERPVVISRSPAWHKYNVIGQTPRLVEGDAIKVNTFITEGQNADFDGDTMTVHVPSSAETVKEVREKLMASKMLFSIKNPDNTLANPKHEQLIGLTQGSKMTGGKRVRFKTKEEAMQAIRDGHVDLHDDIDIG